ncbi:MAG: hypothetical protein ABEJ35_05970 [Halobacteriaceae archaeon]
MGVRPPADDDGEAELIEFGIAALEPKLSESDLTYPATTADVQRALGDVDVEYDAAGNSVALSTVLERAEQDHFDSERELLNALHPVFEDLRNNSSSGVLGWLRSLFRR